MSFEERSGRQAAPLGGLGLSWRSDRLGSLIVALTMASSLIFPRYKCELLRRPDFNRIEVVQKNGNDRKLG